MFLIQKLKYNSFMALLHYYLFAGKRRTSSCRDSKPVAAFMAHHEQDFINRKKNYHGQPAELHFITGTV
jgi:hypothetical protein